MKKKYDETQGGTEVQPVIFRLDSERREIVQVKQGVCVEEVQQGVEMKIDAKMSYGKAVDEYKEIYKQMVLWETIVKKKEEQMAKGGEALSESPNSIAFLENARNVFAEFKRKERDHILSGSIDERNVWEDSDEEEGDEDSVKIVESENEEMDEISGEENSEDEELESDEHDPFSEDSDGVISKQETRKNKRKKNDDNIDNKSISDDETVVMGENNERDGDINISIDHVNNEPNDNSKGWTEVTRKNTRGKLNKENNIGEKVNLTKVGLTQAKLPFGKSTEIKNPYYKRVTDAPRENPPVRGLDQENREQIKKGSLPSYLEAINTGKRKENQFQVRCNFSWTPRVGSVVDFKRAAIELLSFAARIDPSVVLLPWKEGSEFGPINGEDLMNPRSYLSEIIHYIDKPPYAPIQPGVPIYRMGILFSISIDKYIFLKKWNLKRQELRKENLVSYAINMAPMQRSHKAFLIGIAAGSTENQDCELLNKRLEHVTGIQGIEASFQNINQTGVTQDFWKVANAKAMEANSNKNSRAHLQCKYKWAPNGLGIFVSSEELVDVARQKMINMFGKFKDVEDPIWPDGSRMRFLPLKSGTIKSDRTRELVKKRFAYHIWLKANEFVITTNMINIHDTRESFGGKTFSELVLEQMDKNVRVFSHFKRVWHQDPGVTRWGLSVHKEDREAALIILSNIKESLEEQYGSEIRDFFGDKQLNLQRSVVRNTNDDTWFSNEEEDAFDKMISLKDGFIQFLNGGHTDNYDDNDKESVASWGTGDTNYTGVISPTGKETIPTDSSTITSDPGFIIDKEEIELRRKKLCEELGKRKVPTKVIEDIISGRDPYGMIINGVAFHSWNLENSTIMAVAMWEYHTKSLKKNE